MIYDYDVFDRVKYYMLMRNSKFERIRIEFLTNIINQIISKSFMRYLY